MAVDYSKIPTADLEALSKNDYSKVSTSTLEYLSGNSSAKAPDNWGKQYGEIKSETWKDRLKSDLIQGYRNVVRPAAETGGMVAGAAVGVPAGTLVTGGNPVGGAVGGVAGAAGGNAIVGNALDVFEQAVGLQKPKTFKEAAKATGGYATQGALGEMGGQIVGKGIGLVSNKAGEALVRPEVRDFVNAAKQAKYPITPAEETGKKGAALIEKVLSFLPGSASTMQAHHVKQLEHLTKMREQAIDLINQGKGSPEAAERIGMQIKNYIDKYVVARQGTADANTMKLVDATLKKIGSKDSYESLQSNFQKALEQRSQIANVQKRQIYNDIGKYVPEGDYETPNLAKVAEEKLKDISALPNQDKELVNTLNWILKKDSSPMSPEIKTILAEQDPRVRAKMAEAFGITPEVLARAGQSQTPRNWKTLQDFRAMLNDLSKGSNEALRKGSPNFSGQATKENPIYNELKKALDKDLEGIAKDSGSEAYDRLMVANKWFSDEYAPIWKNKEIKDLAYKDPQAIIKTVFTKDFSIADADRLSKAVGQDKFIDLQKGWVSRLFQNASKSGEPSKIWENVYKQLADYGREPLAAMFKKNPQDLQYLMTALSKGMSQGNQPIANKFFMDVLKKSTPDTVLNALFHKNNSRNILLADKVLPKELMSEARAQWVADNVLVTSKDFGMYRPTTSAKNIGKLDRDTYNAIVPKEAREFMDRLQKLSRGAEHIEKLAGNPSGTAQSLITYEVGMATLAGGWDVLAGTFTGDASRVGRGLLKASAMTLGPRALAKIYLSPTGRKLFAEGMKLPANSPRAAKIISQLVGVIGKENLQQDQGGTE